MFLVSHANYERSSTIILEVKIHVAVLTWKLCALETQVSKTTVVHALHTNKKVMSMDARRLPSLRPGIPISIIHKK